MPRWAARVVARIRSLAEQQRVRFTLKALHELETLGLGLDTIDACQVLSQLTVREMHQRAISAVTGEWMYVFKVGVAGTRVYLKLVLRTDCVVVSFHEEEDRDDQNGGE